MESKLSIKIDTDTDINALWPVKLTQLRNKNQVLIRKKV